MATLDRFFGGPPLWVILRLLVLCVVVGLILSALGLHPYTLVDNFLDLLYRLWSMGFDAFDRLAEYFILGAVVVIPIWLLSRLFGARRGRE